MISLDRCSRRLAGWLGLDPCVAVVWVRWFFAVRPEVRAVYRILLERVKAGAPTSGRYAECALFGQVI